MEDLNYVTWYVVFTSKEVNHHPIQFLLKKPFYHCYCFRQIGEYIYFANPTTANIDSRIYHKTEAEELAQAISRELNTKVLKFKYKFDFKNRMFKIWNVAPTCVSVVKMFLGITADAQTPYQLYRHLLRKGALHLNVN